MTILTAILEVFSSIGTWIVETIAELMPMFYVAETGLTLLGILAVCGLGMSIIFLLIGIIQSFLRFR